MHVKFDRDQNAPHRKFNMVADYSGTIKIRLRGMSWERVFLFYKSKS